MVLASPDKDKCLVGQFPRGAKTAYMNIHLTSLNSLGVVQGDQLFILDVKCTRNLQIGICS